LCAETRRSRSDSEGSRRRRPARRSPTGPPPLPPSTSPLAVPVRFPLTLPCERGRQPLSSLLSLSLLSSLFLFSPLSFSSLLSISSLPSPSPQARPHEPTAGALRAQVRHGARQPLRADASRPRLLGGPHFLRRDEMCPVSTGGGTRCVQLVRGTPLPLLGIRHSGGSRLFRTPPPPSSAPPESGGSAPGLRPPDDP
jgi:hypothetical protein